MADESYTFTAARARLEEIVAQVRKKDVSLERSLDLLEEGVRLANVCTELSAHTEWRSVVEEQGEPEGASAEGSAEEAAAIDLEAESDSDELEEAESVKDSGESEPEDAESSSEAQ